MYELNPWQEMHRFFNESLPCGPPLENVFSTLSAVLPTSSYERLPIGVIHHSREGIRGITVVSVLDLASHDVTAVGPRFPVTGIRVILTSSAIISKILITMIIPRVLHAIHPCCTALPSRYTCASGSKRIVWVQFWIQPCRLRIQETTHVSSSTQAFSSSNTGTCLTCQR